MVTEDYVSFETAKLLKDNGFNENCCHYYCEFGYHGGRTYVHRMFSEEAMCNGENETPGFLCTAPTLQMAMKWLLNVHNIYVTILQTEHTTVTMEQRYFFYRVQKNRKNAGIFTDTFMKPEEACEAAIKWCLENLF